MVMDLGSEFQGAFRAYLEDKGVTSEVSEAETHEQLSRLNVFHRYYRERYNRQWAKFKENRKQYGGPVRWVADDQGGGYGTEALLSSAAGADAKQKGGAKKEREYADDDDDDFGGIFDDPPAQPSAADQPPSAADAPEVASPAADATSRKNRWRISFWNDWLNDSNNAKKKTAFRGAEVRTVKGRLVATRVPKSPAEINDAMVENLIRTDNARRLEVKQRVDDWVKANKVVWQEALPAEKKDLATRARLDLLRSKFVKDIGWKGTVNAGSRWTARHYPIKNRVGTNTFEIAHEHGIDFPTVWPMYRIRLVPNPSRVAQPLLKETQRNTVIQTKEDLEESDLELYLRLRKEEQELLAAEAAKQDA